MEKEIIEKYKKAGKIAANILQNCKSFLKPGTKLIEVAEWIENEIIRNKGEVAFPVNISINNVAAHYTPDFNDTTTFKEGDMVKIDIGVHVDGYIGDTAATFVVGKPTELDKKLIETCKKALKEAVKIVSPGLRISEIGEVIEAVASEAGFKPIRNLTGHGLERFNLHAEPQILNIKNELPYVLTEGQVIAIEPFITNGSGIVKEGEETLIFSIYFSKPVRNIDARKILTFGNERYGLPFAKRWVMERLKLSEVRFRIALRELEKRNLIYSYPILKDIEGCKIAQFEHTIIVLEKPIITTLTEP